MTIPMPENWPVYTPDPKCKHQILVDTLPGISEEERRRIFNETGEIVIRLRQWTCVACGGGSLHWFLALNYDVDTERKVATRKPDTPAWWMKKRQRGGKHQRAAGAQ